VATGEIAAESDERQLEPGEAVMAAGRLSVARRVTPDRPRLPFSPGQLARLDEALTLSTRTTGIEFAIYLGDLTENTREQAEQLHASLGARAGEGVLIAVSPNQRRVEIVTGAESGRRIPDRSCKLAIMSLVASCKEGELINGLLSSLRMLSDSAGSQPH
jgi:hypothetical protein